MRKINTAILGCGHIAGLKQPGDKSFLNHAKELKLNKNYNLVACIDNVSKKRKSFAKTYRIPFSFNSIEDLFKTNLKIDLIVVCTNAKFHFLNLKEILRFNVANILCEKPLCEKRKDLNLLNNLLIKKKTQLFTNFNRKEDKTIKNLKNIIKKNRMGKIQLIRGIYTDRLLNNGIHLIDLLSHLMGDLKITKLFKQKKGQSIFCLLENKDKVPIFINNLNDKIFALFEIDFIFQKGRIKYSDNGMKVEQFYIEKNKFFSKKKKLKLVPKISKTEFLKTFKNQYKKIYMMMKKTKNKEFYNSKKIHQLCFNILERSKYDR